EGRAEDPGRDDGRRRRRQTPEGELEAFRIGRREHRGHGEVLCSDPDAKGGSVPSVFSVANQGRLAPQSAHLSSADFFLQAPQVQAFAQSAFRRSSTRGVRSSVSRLKSTSRLAISGAVSISGLSARTTRSKPPSRASAWTT